jgi:hypothetical protein
MKVRDPRVISHILVCSRTDYTDLYIISQMETTMRITVTAWLGSSVSKDLTGR